MPLNEKGMKIKAAMERQYGKAKGKGIFYASEAKGTIKNVKSKIGEQIGAIKSKIKEKATRAVEDLTGITSERKALQSEAFERFKKANPKEAEKYKARLKIITKDSGK